MTSEIQGRRNRARLVAQTVILAGLSLAIAACNEVGPLAGSEDVSAASPHASSVPGENPGDVKYFPSDEPMRLAKERFHEGNFGLAQRYFQDAVEKAPKDVAAWIGLAASYDRLGRFDLADRAYRSAVKLSGRTVQILNNEGYSNMLRGNLKAAREKFNEALDREPNNPTIINNLALLDSSTKYISRAGE
jgi:tetratricopeptide (TPR) repeat protein